jgi:hypothetical protein
MEEEMILTVEEAKTKWCYRSIGSVVDEKCVADECMAWREYGSTKNEKGEVKELGYCGLAGVPE